MNVPMFRYRETLSVRLEDRGEDMSDGDGSEVMDGSVVSSVTDKYGFMGGEEIVMIIMVTTLMIMVLQERRETSTALREPRWTWRL